MGREEDLQNLIDDPQFEQAMTTLNNLNGAIVIVLSTRETTLRNLKKLKREVEESYDKSRKALIGGTTGTVVGSALAITGFGLSFFTFGASLGFTVAGTVLSAAGGVTAAGADIGYLVVTQHNFKHVQMALDTDREMMEKAKRLNDELATLLDSLAVRYPTIPQEDTFTILHQCQRFGKPAAKAMWSGYKLIDGAFDIGKTVATVAGATKAGAKVSHRTVWSGLSTAKKVVGVVGVVFDVVFIPIDLLVMVKAAIDVHKYETQGESNSVAAEEIGKLIKQLEQHRDQLINNQP